MSFDLLLGAPDIALGCPVGAKMVPSSRGSDMITCIGAHFWSNLLPIQRYFQKMMGSAFAMDVVVACVSLMNREEVWRREGSKSDRAGGWRIHFVCLF